MVSLGNAAVAAFVGFVFLVSLMNPGGGFVAVIIALIIIGLYLLIPFVQEYVLSVNKGKAARKARNSSGDSGGDRQK